MGTIVTAAAAAVAAASVDDDEEEEEVDAEVEIALTNFFPLPWHFQHWAAGTAGTSTNGVNVVNAGVSVVVAIYRRECLKGRNVVCVEERK